MSAASYRLLGPAGTQLEAGSGDVTLADGVLELRPAAGAALRVPSAGIAAVAEPEPFTVLVTLADGTALELSRLGRMRTQLLEDLRDTRAEAAAAASGAVGAPVRFTGAVGADPADLYVYEDALLVMMAGRALRAAFSFVGSVQAHDYTVRVEVAGQPPLAVSRLGPRTGEFAGLLTERLAGARTRTSAFLGSLLPGLDPMALRAAAGLLRDGVAVPAAALDALHPDLSATLLRVATLPDRYPGVAELAGQADLAVGFKQVSSVRRAAVGATPWQDPSVTPHIGQHDTPGGRFGTGFGGMLGAGLMGGLGPGGGYPGGGGYGGPFGGGPGGFGGLGGLGGYWAFRALGGGANWGQGGHEPSPSPRADVRHGVLIPETADLTALTTSGDDPTVLAFALLSPRGGGDPVAFEVLNRPEPATYVYRAGGRDPRSLVNQALDEAGFDAAAVYAAASGDLGAAARPGAAAALLGRSVVAAVPHDAQWPARLAAQLSG